jgi:transcriptional regulator with XRE-family HTH domain
MTSLPPHASEKNGNARRRSKGTRARVSSQSQLRDLRLQRGLTQAELAMQCDMHRNSIGKLEKGTTKEITAENASALAAVLKTSVSHLGLRVRVAAEARSIRIRRLTAEQRQIVDDLLSLPPEDYVLIRGAIEQLRIGRTKKRPVRAVR